MLISSQHCSLFLVAFLCHLLCPAQLPNISRHFLCPYFSWVFLLPWILLYECLGTALPVWHAPHALHAHSSIAVTFTLYIWFSLYTPCFSLLIFALLFIHSSITHLMSFLLSLPKSSVFNACISLLCSIARCTTCNVVHRASLKLIGLIAPLQHFLKVVSLKSFKIILMVLKKKNILHTLSTQDIKR